LVFAFRADFGFTGPFIYSFTAVHSFIAISCNLMVTFGDAHWAELIRQPAHPGSKEVKVREHA